MSYVQSNLLNGEQVVYETRLHPIIFTRAIVLACIGLFCIVVMVSANAPVGLGVIGLLFLIFAGISATGTYITQKTSEFAVTDRRVLIKVGWIRRASLEIMLPKVEGIGVDQGILGRVFDFGTIVVRGTGGTHERFPNISAPLDFRKQVQERLPS